MEEVAGYMNGDILFTLLAYKFDNLYPGSPGWIQEFSSLVQQFMRKDCTFFILFFSNSEFFFQKKKKK